MTEGPRTTHESASSDATGLTAWESLTPEQQQAIEQGPGWVPEPVDLAHYTDVASFRVVAGSDLKYGSNNFPGFFTRTQRGSITDIVEATPAFQRFRILYPEKLARLDQLMAACEARPSNASDEVWEELLTAYQLMKNLVDLRDPGVVEKGKVDPFILTR